MKPELLKGVKIIDFTTYVAAPCTAKLFADWGADVIKVEGFSGDPMRNFGANMGDTPYSDDENPVWELENGNKRDIAIDLKNPKGIEVMYKLLSEADAFISNVRLGSLKKLGLDYESLCDQFPKLVVGHISGYGLYGAEAPRPGYDVVSFWARGGSLIDMPPEGCPPVTTPYGIGDHTTGLALASGVLAGVINAQRTGKGEKIVVSLYGTAVWVNSLMVVGTQYGDVHPKSRYLPGNPFTNTYKCKDGEWVTLTILAYERYWDIACDVFGMDDLKNDENYRTLNAVTSKPEYLEHCCKRLEEQFALYDRAYWVEKLIEADIAFEAARHWKDIANDKQAIENNFVKEFSCRNGNKFMLPMSPVQFKGDEGLDSDPAPLVGEQTEDILRELGYSDTEIKELIENKAVVQSEK